jgi:glycosyltransferase involved in cell wall biosynthesis
MKSVIMIAYGFPPEGNAGAYRPLRFVTHLPAHAWSASVVSAAPASYERYDSGLLSLIPDATHVVRVPCRDPWQAFQARRASRVQSILTHASLETIGQLRRAHEAPIRSFFRDVVRRAEAWCYHPDMAMGWIPLAVKATVTMAASRRADVIWATAGPVSSLVVARSASQRTGVPYVLDFRDAWTITFNEFEAMRPAWATRADHRRLYRLLAEAQAVTFRSHKEAECYWRAYAGAFDASKVHIIPNGFEGSIDQSVIPDGDKCTLLYTGTLSSYRYDTLLQGLRRLKESDPARAARLQLLVVGEEAAELSKDAAAHGVAALVKTVGPKSQAEIVRLEREAHALLVLGRPQTMKGYELFASAKLFGYLRAGRPIVGVLPSDETNRILRSLGVSTVADSDSVPEVVAVLHRLLDAWTERALQALVPSRTACEAYSADRQTLALVRALEGQAATEPFVPNVVEIPASLRSDLAVGLLTARRAI